MDGVEKKSIDSLIISLDKALNGMPPLLRARLVMGTISQLVTIAQFQ